LGFNVVRYFYHRDLNSPPGKITDMKDESVCNVFLAVLCKRAGLHRFLCHFSSPLQTAIVRFCEALDEKEAEYLASDSEIPQLYWQDMDAPKAMSDVLEAIVGAVFLDSNLNVEMSWKVMEKLWKPMVDEFIRPAFIKRHPVRELGLLLRHVGCDVWKIVSLKKNLLGREQGWNWKMRNISAISLFMIMLWLLLSIPQRKDQEK
jgi:endoribonuclease Dicer